MDQFVELTTRMFQFVFGWDLHNDQHEQDYANFRMGLALAVLYVLIAAPLARILDTPYGKFGALAEKSPTLLQRIIYSGIPLNARLGWMLMEIPSPIFFSFTFFQQTHATEPSRLFFACLYLFHYANRAFFFPLSIRVAPGSKANFGTVTIIFGVLMTSLHGYLNGKWLGQIAPNLNASWFSDIRFLFGFALYEYGFWQTVYLEHIMRNLRPIIQPGSKSNNPANPEPKYKIPRGGLFEYATSAQYFTELIAWFGWVVITWSPAASFVFTISCANLIPRAIKQHAWYLEKFKDEYPKERKILIPFVY